MRQSGDLHITDSSAPGGMAPLAGESEILSGRGVNREILVPEGERKRFIGCWSITTATELLWSLIKRQINNM